MRPVPTDNPGRTPALQEACGLLLGLLLLAALPAVFTDGYSRHVLIMAFIYAVIASNWDLSLGYGGIFNFAHLALFGIGVYTYAILAKSLGLEPWVALLCSGLSATVAAVVVTVPILRLKGIYIILVTFGFSQLIMQIVLSQSAITGGTEGMVRIPSLRLFDHNMIRDGKLGYFYIMLTILALSTLFLRGFVRSSSGLATVALRDNEEYAVSRGISLLRQRLLTLASSAFFTGVAGAFYASYQRNASVDVFGMSLSTVVLSMVLLGGPGTIYGAILASFVLTVFSETLADWGALRPMIVAALILGVMLAYPSGLVGLIGAIWSRFGVLTARLRGRTDKRATQAGPPI